MTDKSSLKASWDEKLFGQLTLSFVVLLPIVIGVLIFVFFEYGNVSKNEIGQIGEFFGGWLTPIMLSFVLVLLIFSVRFQVNQLQLTREELHSSAESQEHAAKSQADMLYHAQRSFELEANAKGLINLVEQTEGFVNTKVNLYVDIINFDNKLPHETRLFNLIDNWRKELEQGTELQIKCRNERDEKYVEKYLHSLHHELYVCQSLIRNKGWVYLSPYLNSVREQLEATITLHQVGLINDKSIWMIKQAVSALYNKIQLDDKTEALVGDELIEKLLKDTFRELLFQLPTPEAYQYEDDKE